MKNSGTSLSRRALIRTATLAAAGALAPAGAKAPTAAYAPSTLKPPTADADLPIRLGIASYTFRNFDSAHLIDFMHQLRTPLLNLKDAHLPMQLPGKVTLAQIAEQAVAYRAAGFILRGR